jgi:hypothetical protein
MKNRTLSIIKTSVISNLRFRRTALSVVAACATLCVSAVAVAAIVVGASATGVSDRLSKYWAAQQIALQNASTSVAFKSSSTWTAPVGVTSVTINEWGAGQAGAHVHAPSVPVTPGHTYSVTIGTARGGGGGSSSFENDGPKIFASGSRGGGTANAAKAATGGAGSTSQTGTNGNGAFGGRSSAGSSGNGVDGGAGYLVLTY